MVEESVSNPTCSPQDQIFNDEERPSPHESHPRAEKCSIHCLPTDILSDLFSEVVSDCHAPIQSHSSFVLSQVCQLWRILALSMPTLWSRLTIDYSFLHDLPHAITRFLMRSIPVPLHLTIRAQGDYNGSNARIVTPILVSILKPTSHRWKRVDISIAGIQTERLLWPLLQGQPSDFAQLQEVRTNLLGPWSLPESGTDETPIQLDDFPMMKAPGLRTLSVDIWSGSRTIAPEWSNLTSLSLKAAISNAKFLDVLTRCTSLISLDVHIFDGSAVVASGNDVVERRGLKHLCVVQLSTTPPIEPLLVLRLPSLVSFSLELRDADRRDKWKNHGVHTINRRFLNQWGTQLVELTLIDCVVEEIKMVELLELVSNLKVLRVSAPATALPLTTFHRLTPHKTSNGLSLHGTALLCPHLRSLTLEVSEERYADPAPRIESTLALINSRAARGIAQMSVISSAWATAIPRCGDWDKVRVHLSKDWKAEFDRMESNKDELVRRVAESDLTGRMVVIPCEGLRRCSYQGQSPFCDAVFAVVYKSR